MRAIIGDLVDWWRRRRRNAARIDQIRNYPAVATMPKNLDRHVLALAGDPVTWAVLHCPCGHGHQLRIRVRPNGNAVVWRVTETDLGPSLFPSVDFVSSDRRCHFWLDRGRVKWVRDDTIR